MDGASDIPCKGQYSGTSVEKNVTAGIGQTFAEEGRLRREKLTQIGH